MRNEGKLRKRNRERERDRKERLRDKETEWERDPHTRIEWEGEIERERDRERETEKERDSHTRTEWETESVRERDTHTHREAQAHIKKQNNRIIEWYLPIAILLLILAFEPCERTEEKPKKKRKRDRTSYLNFFFDKIEKISVSSYDKFK